MSTEKPPTNLYTALLAAQRVMGKVKKDASNPAFRTKYATLQSVLETVDGPLSKNGLVLLQRFRQGPDGPLLVTAIVHAASGEAVESEIAVVGKDASDPQKMGGAITYYRRYSLLALLGLAPEDDDGHAAAQPTRNDRRAEAATARPVPAKVTPTPIRAPEPEPPIEAEDDPPIVLRDDEALIDMVRNDFATPDERWDALWDFYDKATDPADLNRRVERVKNSGMPTRELEAAFRQKHTALAQQLGLAGGAQVAG